MEKNSQRHFSSGHVLGLNKFADMSNEEFKKVYSRKLKKSIRTGRTSVTTSCETPASMDWRKRGAVTAIKDQGNCGSCWAFSSTGDMEGINKIVTGDLISLSEQELVDCDTTNEGCNGGTMDYAFEWVISNGGIDNEANYPYTGVDGTCNTTQDGNALLSAVVQQPISVGIDGSSLDFQLYTGGIYKGDCSADPNDIDHAVLIVGYGSEGDEDYWIVKNSWGTSWGINGYIYIKRNTDLLYGVCAINAMASYPTKGYSSPPPFPTPSASPPPPSDCGDYAYCSGTRHVATFLNSWTYASCTVAANMKMLFAVVIVPTAVRVTIPSVTLKRVFVKGQGDYVRMPAKRQRIARQKLPWSKIERFPTSPMEEEAAS